MLYKHLMRLVMMFLLVLCFDLSGSEWKVVKEQNGIRVSTREVEGSTFLAFRGETVVEAGVASLVALLYDTPTAPKWLHECSLGMTLEEVRFDENYIFQIYDLPFPVSNRKVTLHTSLTWTGEEARLETREANDFCQAHASRRCTDVEAADMVMIERSRGYYLFRKRDANHTEVIWQQHIEPGGKVPGWLANMLVVDIPYHSLLAMKTLIRDKKYASMSKAKLQTMWSDAYGEHH